MDSLMSTSRKNLIGRRQALLSAERQAPGGDGTGEEGERLEPVDAAARVTERQLAQSLTKLWRRELQEIEAALRRMDEGRWGLCEDCGAAIGRQRLLALPEARHCLACRARPELPR